MCATHIKYLFQTLGLGKEKKKSECVLLFLCCDSYLSF